MSDAELIEIIVVSVRGMVVGIHANDRVRVGVELTQLVTAIIEHRNSMGELRSNEPLRRAIARLR